MISAKVVADSLSPQGDRLVSVLIVLPRIILSELNTHKMLSKNTASSRAIPFPKMVETVNSNPFIPIAWQKYHPGMQGSEYLDGDKVFNLVDFVETLSFTLNQMLDPDSDEYVKEQKRLTEKINLINSVLVNYTQDYRSLTDWWLLARDKAVEMATILYVFDVTKQLCNRLLEPFMWVTALVTGNIEGGGWNNFFNLRCPQYKKDNAAEIHKSWKDVINEAFDKGASRDWIEELENYSILDRLKYNKGQAEIHMMQLAECIYDAFQESNPKQLKAGEWHTPFDHKLVILLATEGSGCNHVGDKWVDTKIKCSTAMAARTSYTSVGDEKVITWGKLVELDDKLLNQEPPHSSPMEHCGQAMDDEQYESNVKGEIKWYQEANTTVVEMENSTKGWCRNFKGFIPRRHIIETKS